MNKNPKKKKNSNCRWQHHRWLAQAFLGHFLKFRIFGGVFVLNVVLGAGHAQFWIYVGVYLFGKVLPAQCPLSIVVKFPFKSFSIWPNSTVLKFHFYMFQNSPQKNTCLYCYESLNCEYNNTLWPFWRMFPHPLYIMYYLVYFFMLFWNGLPITNILISK